LPKATKFVTWAVGAASSAAQVISHTYAEVEIYEYMQVVRYVFHAYDCSL
jgi:hypothetical protein